MKNKKLTLGLGIIIIVSAIFFFINEGNTIIGDTPSYIPISSCSQEAQFLINEKDFPTNLIAGCNTTKHKVDRDTFYVVTISYGEAQDCPAGCFYDTYIAAVPKNGGTFYDLSANPASESFDVNNIYTEVSFGDESGHTDHVCPTNLESVTKTSLARENGKIGWKFEFIKPFTCTWKELSSTKVTMDNTFIHTGVEITNSWNGSWFAYHEDETYQWDLSKLISKEISRNKITFEEN